MSIINNSTFASKILIFTVLFGSQTFVACQVKRESASENIERCQQLLDKDDFIAANRCFGKAIAMHPKDASRISETSRNSLYDKCEEFLLKKKDYEQAIVCFEGLSILAPDVSIVFINLADAYYRDYLYAAVKDPLSLENGERAAKRAIELRPESALAHSTYGLILFLKRDLQGAVRAQREAVKLEPNDSLYRVTLGIVLDEANDPVAALESYQTALKLEPNNVGTFDVLSGFYKKYGRLDEAIATLEKLAKLKPEDQKKIEAEIKRLKTIRQLQRSTKQPNPR